MRSQWLRSVRFRGLVCNKINRLYENTTLPCFINKTPFTVCLHLSIKLLTENDLHSGKQQLSQSVHNRELMSYASLMLNFHPKLLCSIALWSCVLVPMVTLNAELSTERIPLLTAPERANTKLPNYPQRVLSNGEEGWVQLHAMISPNGKAYDIVVEDAVGHPAFRPAAIRSLERTRFKPGTYRGNAVDSAYSHKMIFSVSSGGTKNRYFSEFKPAFHRVVDAVRAKNGEQAQSELRRLAELRKTLYEDALY